MNALVIISELSTPNTLYAHAAIDTPSSDAPKTPIFLPNLLICSADMKKFAKNPLFIAPIN